MDQKDKIAILGFGVEGKACFEYLIAHGYGEITVCDKNVDLKDKMPDGVSVRLGEHYLNDLDEFDVLFRSPGVKWLDPHVQSAIAKGVSVTSCTGYFMDQCPCPVVGVTGTKGKGTTSTLISLMLEKKFGEEKVFLGGNIGRPAMGFLDELEGDNVVVLELSSFQLQDLEKSPHYVAFLNTTLDHLDYHVDSDEYMAAKENILAHQGENGVVVLNRDYEYSKRYKPLVKGQLLEVSVDEETNGAYVKDDVIYYKGDKVCDVSEMALLGTHNLENIMPAVCIAGEMDVSLEDIADVIRTFSGLPNRLEFVRELNDVKFYNDSFSTTPETSMAAVESFDEPMVLIAGGSDKGLDYSEWAVKILTKTNLHTVVLMGQIAEEMEQAIFDAKETLGEAQGSPTKLIRRSDFEEVVLDAFAEAREGGVVVMSPATASFDMFDNYKHRAQRFKEEVAKLR